MRIETATATLAAVSAAVLGAGTLAFGIYLWNWVGVVEDDRPEHLPRSEATFRDLVGATIEPGQDEETARAGLLALGLDCREDTEPGTRQPRIVCGRDHGAIIVTTWMVVLEIDRGRVARVWPVYGLTGP